MADNVLKAVIDVSAPGAKQAFQETARGAQSLQDAFDDLKKKGIVSIGAIESAMIELKSAIKQSTDPGDIAKLNQALSFLQAREKDLKATGLDEHLSKVHTSTLRANSAALNLAKTFQILPVESSHIAHGLESIINAFEHMEEQTGSVGGAIKTLAGSLGGAIGLGLVVAGVSKAFEYFSEELFSNKEKLEADKESLDRIRESIANVKEETEALNDQIAFNNKLGSLRIKIAGLGEGVSIGAEVIQQNEKILKLYEELNKAQENQLAAQQANISQGTEDSKKLEDEATKAFKEASKKYEEALKDRQILFAQAELQQIEDQKKADEEKKKLAEKALKDYQEYLKRLEEERKRAFQKEQEWYQVRYAIAKDFEDRMAKIRDTVQTGNSTKGEKYDPAKEIKGMTGAVQDALNKIAKESKDRADEIIQNMTNVANTISSILVPAFDGFFKALQEGQNPIKGFLTAIQQAIAQVIQKFIQAAITALIFKAILGPGGASFGELFSKFAGFGGGKALGGPVKAGVGYLVGEHGPEYFVPDTGGSIISNNQLRSSGRVQAGQITGKLITSSKVSGADLVFIHALELRRQGRLNG